MSSFQKQLKRAKRQFMIVSSTWTSNKKKIHSLENLCKRSGGKTFFENGIFWNRDIKWGKKDLTVWVHVFVSATQRIVWTKGQECVLSGHQHLHPILQSFVWLCLRFGGFLSIIGRGFIGFKAGSRGDRGSRVRISWELDTVLSQGFESRKRFSLGLRWPN